MSINLRSLNNIRILRAQTRELEVSALEEMMDKLRTVIAERRKESEAYEAIMRQKTEKMAFYRELLLEDGIKPSELISTLKNGKHNAKRSPRPAKYKYVDEHGQDKYWTGQGRTPAVINEALKNGANLDDFLI